MDTRHLAQALRDATDGLEPRSGFADDVVTGSRRRRTRNRITVATTVAGAAAVAAAVVAAGTSPLPDPPPPGSSTAAPSPKHDWRLRHLAGDRSGDTTFTTEAIEAWNTGLRGDGKPVGWSPELDERPGDPHVYWAGSTPYGDAAIVVEPVRLGPNVERVLTGVVTTRPGTPKPALLGVQLDNPGDEGNFLLPDNRTVLAVAHPEDALWVSPEIRYTGDGSRRDWTPVPVRDGVGLARLPEGTNPLNVRLVAGDPGTPPDRDGAKLGGHLPLVLTRDFGAAVPSEPVRRGLPWDGVADVNGDLSDLFDPAEQFTETLRDSGLLDPYSYRDRPSPWLIVARVYGGVLILGEVQELDHPAYVYAVAPGPDGRYVAKRLYEADPGATLPVVHRLPDDAGWLVAAFGKPLSHRLSPTGPWQSSARDVAWFPAPAVQVRVGNEVVDLP